MNLATSYCGGVLSNTEATLPAEAQCGVSSQVTFVPDYFRAVVVSFCFSVFF